MFSSTTNSPIWGILFLCFFLSHNPVQFVFSQCAGPTNEGDCLSNINAACEYFSEPAECELRNNCMDLGGRRRCMLGAVCNENSSRTTTKCIWNQFDGNGECECRSGHSLVFSPGTFINPTEITPDYAFSMQDLSGNLLHLADKPAMFEGDGTPIGTSPGFCASINPKIGGNSVPFNVFKFSAPLPSNKLRIPITVISGNTVKLPSLAAMQIFFYENATNFAAYRRLDTCYAPTGALVYKEFNTVNIELDNLDPTLDLLLVFMEWDNFKKKRSEREEEETDYEDDEQRYEGEYLNEGERALQKRSTGFAWEYHIVFGPMEDIRCSSLPLEDDCLRQVEFPCRWDGSQCVLRESCSVFDSDPVSCMVSNFCNSNDTLVSPGKCAFSIEQNVCLCDDSSRVPTTVPMGNFQTPLSLSESLSFAFEDLRPNRFNLQLLPVEVYENNVLLGGNGFVDDMCPAALSNGFDDNSRMSVIELPLLESTINFTAIYYWGAQDFNYVMFAFYQMRDTLSDGNYTLNKVGDCVYAEPPGSSYASVTVTQNTTLTGLDPSKPLLVVFSYFTPDKRKRNVIEWDIYISLDYSPRPDPVVSTTPAADNDPQNTTTTTTNPNTTTITQSTSTPVDLFSGSPPPLRQPLRFVVWCLIMLQCCLMVFG